MGIEFLKANKDDIKNLVDLRIKLNQHDYNLENTAELESAIENLLQEELNRSIYFFIAKENEKTVACSGLIVHQVLPYSTITSGKKGYITNVFTEENFRNQGIQKELVRRSLDLAKEIGCERVELDACNSNAINLYENIGFEKISSRFSINL